MSAGLLIAAALLAPLVAQAQTQAQPQAQAQLYDPPVSTRTVRTGGTEIRCTFYPDLMVRESGTDSPAPDPIVLLPGHGQPCSAVALPHQVVLKGPGYSFMGRRGAYLMLGATDPNGAVPFMVTNLAGRLLYADATAMDGGIQALTVENDTLHLVFTRGLNAGCSLMRQAAACWSGLVAAGKVPRAMAGLGPTAKDCSPAYGRAKAPPEDPSMIAYAVDMTLDMAGRTQVASRGALSCAPLP